MKDFVTQEMSKQEKAEGLKLLKKYLTKQKATITGAVPYHFYALTSLNGVNGVYFPDSKIEVESLKLMTVLCIAKVDNALGLVFAYDKEKISKIEREGIRNFYNNKSNDLDFADFDHLIYDYDCLDIKKKIEARIKDYEKDLKTLESVEVITKKDGKPFTKLGNNFTNVTITSAYRWRIDVYSVNLYNSVSLHRDNNNHDKDITIEEVKTLIFEEIKRKKERLAKEKQALKDLEQNYDMFIDLCDKIGVFFENVQNKDDFQQLLKSKSTFDMRKKAQ